MRGRSLLALAAVVLVAASAFFWAVYGRVGAAAHIDGVRAVMAGTPDWVHPSELSADLWEIEREFYERRGFVPAWIDGTRTTARLDTLLQQLEDSRAHGLDPERYGADELARIVEESHRRVLGVRYDREQVPELDARFTYAYLSYAADLLGWGSDPGDLRPDWRRAPNTDDLGARLDRAAQGDVRATFQELAPDHPQYAGLQRALTHASSPDERTRIALNLERWRWAPRELGDRHILVNIPAYRLQVMENGAEALTMRVVVGSAEDETPVFSDLMTYLVFSPYWNIPASILRDETLPRAIEDPDYLKRSGIEVRGSEGDEEPLDPRDIDWADEEETKGLRFRQVPGPENALGQVKFIFPNNFAVYFHDTPAEHLFAEPERAFSHGCIRVEQPVALAEYVLAGREEWTADRITAAMHAEAEQTVKLETPLPVHIGYWTAWVEADGSVRYTSDPYQIDAAHARMRGLPLELLNPPTVGESGAPPAE